MMSRHAPSTPGALNSESGSFPMETSSVTNRQQPWYRKLCRSESSPASYPALEDATFPSPQRIQLQMQLQQEYQQLQELQKNCRQAWWQRQSSSLSTPISPLSFQTPPSKHMFFARTPIVQPDVPQFQVGPYLGSQACVPSPVSYCHLEAEDGRTGREQNWQINEEKSLERERMIRAAQMIKCDAEKRIREFQQDCTLSPGGQDSIQQKILQLLREHELNQNYATSTQTLQTSKPTTSQSSDLQHKIAKLIQAYKQVEVQRLSVSHENWQDQIATYNTMLQAYHQGDLGQSYQQAKRLLQLLLQKDLSISQLSFAPGFALPRVQPRAYYQQQQRTPSGSAGGQPIFRTPHPQHFFQTKKDPRPHQSTQENKTIKYKDTPRQNRSSSMCWESEPDDSQELICPGGTTVKSAARQLNSTPRKTSSSESSVQGGKSENILKEHKEQITSPKKFKHRKEVENSSGQDVSKLEKCILESGPSSTEDRQQNSNGDSNTGSGQKAALPDWTQLEQRSQRRRCEERSRGKEKLQEKDLNAPDMCHTDQAKGQVASEQNVNSPSNQVAKGQASVQKRDEAAKPSNPSPAKTQSKSPGGKLDQKSSNVSKRDQMFHEENLAARCSTEQHQQDKAASLELPTKEIKSGIQEPDCARSLIHTQKKAKIKSGIQEPDCARSLIHTQKKENDRLQITEKISNSDSEPLREAKETSAEEPPLDPVSTENITTNKTQLVHKETNTELTLLEQQTVKDSQLLLPDSLHDTELQNTESLKTTQNSRGNPQQSSRGQHRPGSSPYPVSRFQRQSSRYLKQSELNRSSSRSMYEKAGGVKSPGSVTPKLSTQTQSQSPSAKSDDRKSLENASSAASSDTNLTSPTSPSDSKNPKPPGIQQSPSTTSCPSKNIAPKLVVLNPAIDRVMRAETSPPFFRQKRRQSWRRSLPCDQTEKDVLSLPQHRQNPQEDIKDDYQEQKESSLEATSTEGRGYTSSPESNHHSYKAKIKKQRFFPMSERKSESYRGRPYAIKVNSYREKCTHQKYFISPTQGKKMVSAPKDDMSQRSCDENGSSPPPSSVATQKDEKERKQNSSVKLHTSSRNEAPPVAHGSKCPSAAKTKPVVHVTFADEVAQKRLPGKTNQVGPSESEQPSEMIKLSSHSLSHQKEIEELCKSNVQTGPKFITDLSLHSDSRSTDSEEEDLSKRKAEPPDASVQGHETELEHVLAVLASMNTREQSQEKQDDQSTSGLTDIRGDINTSGLQSLEQDLEQSIEQNEARSSPEGPLLSEIGPEDQSDHAQPQATEQSSLNVDSAWKLKDITVDTRERIDILITAQLRNVSEAFQENESREIVIPSTQTQSSEKQNETKEYFKGMSDEKNVIAINDEAGQPEQNLDQRQTCSSLSSERSSPSRQIQFSPSVILEDSLIDRLTAFGFI